jgi:hypothetical protein
MKKILFAALLVPLMALAQTPLSVSQGGTGAATLSGYLYGNGTNAVTGSATLPATSIDYGAGVTALSGVSLPISLFGESAGAWYFSGGGISVTDSSSHAGVGHAAYSFASYPLGTGAIGPTNADFGFSVSLLKQNLGTVNAHAGELDGAYFVVRNDGSNSDTTGFLIDVGNYGSGFNALFEGNNTAFSGGSITQAVNNQAGVVDTRTGSQFGYVVQKTTGNGGVAYLAAQGSGQWQHLLQFSGGGAVRFDMPIDSNNVVTMRMVDASLQSKTIRVNNNALSVVNNAGNAEIFALADNGNLTLGGGIVGATGVGNANSGNVGEYQSATSNGVSLTSNTVTNMASFPLSAGDWDVQGCAQFVPAGSTNIAAIAASISTSSGGLGGLGSLSQMNASFLTGQGDYLCTPTVRENFSSATQVYLTGYSSFGTSSMTANGFIRARRAR